MKKNIEGRNNRDDSMAIKKDNTNTTRIEEVIEITSGISERIKVYSVDDAYQELTSSVIGGSDAQ